MTSNKEGVTEQQCFGLWNNNLTKVTSLVEGELSEPDEVILDSSSADIDIPLNLSWRRKYG